MSSRYIILTANLVVKDNQEWCMDVFDVFVTAGQSVTLGEAVIRRYRPVSADNNHIVLNIFASERDDVKVKNLLQKKFKCLVLSTISQDLLLSYIPISLDKKILTYKNIRHFS